MNRNSKQRCDQKRRDRSADLVVADLSSRTDFGSQGFAQITLLLALAVIGAGLTASLAASRGASQQAAALERLVETDALAGSAHRRLLVAFDAPLDELELRALNGVVPMLVGSSPLELTIESEASKIDLLLADAALIEHYLAQRSLAADERGRLLTAIEDARRRGSAVGAAEAADLGLVGSMRSQELGRDITRFGGTGIDPQYASERVLRAVPDLLAGEAEKIVALGPGQRIEQARASKYFATGGRRFSLVAKIVWPAGQSTERRLPIEISTAGRPILLAGAY